MPLFTTVIEAVADFIQADPYFRDAALLVVPASDKRKLSELQVQIANRIKICAVVIFSGARASHNNVPGPYFDELEIEVQVCENRNINDSGLTVEDAAARIAQIVEDFKIAETASLGLNREFIFTSIEPNQLPPQFGFLAAYSVHFRTGAGDRYTPTRVATPVITQVDNEVTNITCATAGAAIYYTTDGGYPMPPIGTQPATGTEYDSEAISLTPGQRLRVRGFKTALRASAIAGAIGS